MHRSQSHLFHFQNNDTKAFRSDFVQLLIDAETTPDSAADNQLLGITKATDGQVVKLAGAVDVERRLTAEVGWRSLGP